MAFHLINILLPHSYTGVKAANQYRCAPKHLLLDQYDEQGTYQAPTEYEKLFLI
ncbi:MAG: hypothetical protein ACFFGZ_20275 [Candidatus Thorarchaeota archaeon]